MAQSRSLFSIFSFFTQSINKYSKDYNYTNRRKIRCCARDSNLGHRAMTAPYAPIFIGTLGLHLTNYQSKTAANA